MAQISSDEDLEKWLSDKPFGWAQVIAVRAAMRALPFVGGPDGSSLNDYGLLPIRALFFSWAARNFPSHDMEVAARLAGNYYTYGINATVAFGADAAALAAEAAGNTIALESDGSYSSDGSASLATRVASLASVASTSTETLAFVAGYHYSSEGHADWVEPAPDIAVGGDAAADSAWLQISDDCEWLTDRANHLAAARIIARRSLWLGQPPSDWLVKWQSLKQKLLVIDPGYTVWIEWFDRQISGERAAFDIPGDKNRTEDKAILARLADATAEDFWGKGHEYVNATLKGWLEEARERAAQNLPPTIDDISGTASIRFSASGKLEHAPQIETPPQQSGAINPDPQDARSPIFGSDSTGRIAIKPYAGIDQLRSDPQSLSRHRRAIEMARQLGDALRNHNNAGYITEMVGDYVAAMDGGGEDPDPSGLVFAGDQLRGAIAKHRVARPDDDLQPLPASADRDATAFLSAHNMYVGSDPFLDDLDRTTRGPDAPLPTANPEEIRRIATTARQDDILAEGTYDYIVAASDAAPATYDKDDRHSRFAAGLAQNFARYGIELLWAYPNEAAWAGLATGIVATVTLGPLAAAGGTVAGITIAYHLARNMIANEAVFRKLLATSPSGEDNFNRVMRFLKSLPYRSPKDD